MHRHLEIIIAPIVLVRHPLAIVRLQVKDLKLGHDIFSLLEDSPIHVIIIINLVFRDNLVVMLVQAHVVINDQETLFRWRYIIIKHIQVRLMN